MWFDTFDSDKTHFKSKKDGKDQENDSIKYHTWPRIPHGKVIKYKKNITNKSQEVSPFPAGDHKAAMNRRESMRSTIFHLDTNDPPKKYGLGTVSKNVLLHIKKGPPTVSYSISPSFESKQLQLCMIDNCIFVFKLKPVIQCTKQNKIYLDYLVYNF